MYTTTAAGYTPMLDPDSSEVRERMEAAEAALELVHTSASVLKQAQDELAVIRQSIMILHRDMAAFVCTNLIDKPSAMRRDIMRASPGRVSPGSRCTRQW